VLVSGQTLSGGASKFLLASLAVLALSSTFFHRLGYQVLPQEAPPARNAEVARSLWVTHSLEAPEFRVFERELRRLSRETHREWRQDVFSLGRNGELFPKHSLLSGVIGAPFYGVFGDSGFWILQQIISLLLFYSTFRITSLVTQQTNGILTLTTITLLTETVFGFFCYMFSYDLHGLFLLICGLHLMHSRPRWGSALAASSIFVRPSYVILLPFLLSAWSGLPQRIGNPRDILLGTGAVLCLYFAVNDLMWGSPFTTAYHRMVAFSPQGEVFPDQLPSFSLGILLGDWGRKLFDARVGLLIFNPALFAFPWVCAWARRSEHKWFAFSTLAGSVVYGLYMFSYELWDVSFVGNRLLLPSIYLYLLNFVPWCCALRDRVRGGRWEAWVRSHRRTAVPST
jgi:hypothetical protein